MKNILKYLAFFTAIILVVVSCNYDDTNFDSLTIDLDSNATYYIQFSNASQTAETGVTEAGELIEIETTVIATLMGTPQNEDITVNFTIDDLSNTMSEDMYTISANSIIIPAGKTSGSVDFTTIAENMPVGETVTFALLLDAGEHASPNANGTKLTYHLKRMEFCPLDNGAADFVGSWSMTFDVNTGSTANPAWYTENGFTAVVNGDDLDVSGLGESFIAGFWGEPVVAGGTFTMEIAGNGLLTIPRQYIFTTVWNGTNYDYEVEGSGTWENCGDKPVMHITYDIYYPGDAEGLALSYVSYLNVPYLGGSFMLD